MDTSIVALTLTLAALAGLWIGEKFNGISMLINDFVFLVMSVIATFGWFSAAATESVEIGFYLGLLASTFIVVFGARIVLNTISIIREATGK